MVGSSDLPQAVTVQFKATWEHRFVKSLCRRFPVTPGKRWDTTERLKPAILNPLLWRQETLSLKGPEWPSRVAFSPDGRRMVSNGTWTGEVKVWDALTGKEQLSLNELWDGGSFKGGYAAIDASTVGLLGFPSGQGPLLAASALFPGRGSHLGVAFSAFSSDGQRLITVRDDGTVSVWDLTTAERKFSFKVRLGSNPPWRHYTAPVFGSDGRHLVTGSTDGMVRVWDLATGQQLHFLGEHPGPITSVAFSPDGRRIASDSTVGSDGEIRVWDAATGAQLLSLKHAGLRGSFDTESGRAEPVRSLAFSSDGLRLIAEARRAGGPDSDYIKRRGNVKVWDAATGQELLSLTGLTMGVWSLVFSPDGRRIVAGCGSIKTGSKFGEIKFWDAATGQEKLSLRADAASVRSVAFSPDGTRLVGGCSDGTIKVWDAPPLQGRDDELDHFLP
jgi:WD40 repeat protein